MLNLLQKKNIEIMAILEEIAASILSFEQMHPIPLEKLKIAVETHYKLHKTKGKIRPIERYWALLKSKVYEGNWSAINREQLIARIRYVLSKHQDELQSSILKMMDGLPQKLKKAQAEGLNSVL